MTKLRMGTIYRYSRPYSQSPDTIDGLPNHFFTTFSPGKKLVVLDAGINPLAEVETKKGVRRPAVVIRSTPHKIGSKETPWQDTFDLDNGHIRYFGDNKSPSIEPHATLGNRVLLELFRNHTSMDKAVRQKAPPLVFYRAVRVNGKNKGFLEFCGFGIVRSAKLVTQYDRSNQQSFTNYVFDFSIFDLRDSNEQLDWDWITGRRNPELSDADCNIQAPASWREWVSKGESVVEKCRRRVSRIIVRSSAEQIPPGNSREMQTLQQVYDFYTGRKTRFESLAALVAQKVIEDSGVKYRPAWVTSGGADGGADFYGYVDVGSDFGKAKLIVLGQAKCESLTSPTGGNHIARTVARLKRGWLGVYVTTSYFSESVQREVIEDQYPVLLINGKRLAEAILNIIHDNGYKSLEELLLDVDRSHDEQLDSRRPEELYFE